MRVKTIKNDVTHQDIGGKDFIKGFGMPFKK